MKVKIEKVYGKNIVYSTEFGEGTGEWEGNIPEIGEKYFVEIEIDIELVWGRDINYVQKKTYSVLQKNEFTRFSGRLESLEEDGYTTVRISDSIITFISKSSVDFEDAFVEVRVPSDKINLFPIEIC